MPPSLDATITAPHSLRRRSLMALAASSLALPVLAQARSVTIGYQDLLVPMKMMMQASDELERSTGYRVQWKMYDTGADIMKALAAGDIQIGEVGSSPFTAAATAGQKVSLLWICDDMANAEALVVRNSAGVNKMADLSGKTLAAPNLSTAHYQLFAALSEAGLVRNVKLLNLKPPQIRAAWDAGTIDGAYLWNPVLGHLKGSGKVLVSAAQMAQRGYPTFDGLVGNNAWIDANETLVVGLIQAIARAQRSYLNSQASWTAQTPAVQTIAQLTKTAPAEVPGGMALYRFVPPEEQLGARWFGGGAATAMANTALFQSIMLVNSAPLPNYNQFMAPNFLRKAMAAA
ncbi:MAG: taurine ABC transporter substrate-binding protein [Polaromonas sp.]